MPEVRDQVNVKIKPDWLKIRLHNTEQYAQTASIVERHALHTICSSGMCPNKAECWSRRTATLMILGDVCTRACKFCATKTGKTLPIDKNEPERVGRSISLMGLRHAVITSVTRDDLPDRGASHWAAVVEAVRAQNPDTTIEILIPDLDGRGDLLDIVIGSRPDIIGHNVETVERLTPLIRNKACYATSMTALRHIADRGAVAKSGIMLGLGEKEVEVLKTLDDLRENGCEIVTLGQYLQPTRSHWPVAEYVTPAKFGWYGEEARKRGFGFVASGPLVRSSYMAEQALPYIGAKTRKQAWGTL